MQIFYYFAIGLLTFNPEVVHLFHLHLEINLIILNLILRAIIFYLLHSSLLSISSFVPVEDSPMQQVQLASDLLILVA
jgi:hypothetical protein